MSCEKLAEQVEGVAHSHEPGSEEQKIFAQLAMDLVLNCDGYRRSHTSRILAELSGRTDIPEYLREHPEKQQMLVDAGILKAVIA